MTLARMREKFRQIREEWRGGGPMRRCLVWPTLMTWWAGSTKRIPRVHPRRNALRTQIDTLTDEIDISLGLYPQFFLDSPMTSHNSSASIGSFVGPLVVSR
jgi:hypothetical protein